MNPPELKALQEGDAGAWDAAFDWLWPTAFTVAQQKLQPFFPEDIEDVAIEALEELVERVPSLKSAEELKPLTASIAHNRAVSLLRERFARKRGAGRTESLDAPVGDAEAAVDPPGEVPWLVEFDQQELAGLLRELEQALKPEYRAVLDDFFLHRLSYEAIARKRGLAKGSVGVYLKRGLETLRSAASRHAPILKELEAFLR
jgi:RNA polymerase sigma factor (sigma-70 family)